MMKRGGLAFEITRATFLFKACEAMYLGFPVSIMQFSTGYNFFALFSIQTTLTCSENIRTHTFSIIAKMATYCVLQNNDHDRHIKRPTLLYAYLVLMQSLL